MFASGRALVLVLRVVGVVTLLALGAVFMPHVWMSAIHERMGLGPLAETPIIGYLTRSLSGMYAVHGALLLYMSCDVARYLPAIRFLAALTLIAALGLLALDLSMHMPTGWTLAEGPVVLLIGASLLLLPAPPRSETEF